MNSEPFGSGAPATDRPRSTEWARGAASTFVAGAPAADPPRRTERLREAATYVIAAVLSLVLLARVMHLSRADLHVPLNMPGDGIYYGMLIKTMIETGWVHYNPALSAPFHLELFDFAHFDNLHIAIMKGIAFFSSDWGVVANVFYLLTFPLTTLTGLLFFRTLRFSRLVSVTFALLYSFQPYHFLRGQGHIMLAGYYLIPLLVMVALWLFEERALLGAGGNGRAVRLWRSPRFWAAVLICLAASSGGHYYACFGCFFFMVAGLIASVGYRHWRNLRDAGLLIGVVALGFTLNLLPNILYWNTHGLNREVSAKLPSSTEIYSLKVIQLVLPVEHHRLKSLAKLTAYYEANSPLINENTWSSVGVIAAVGFLVLIAAAFAPRRGGSLLNRLSQLNVAAVLLACLGGFGALITYFITPQIHAYNRMSIFIALFGLSAAAVGVRAAAARIGRPLYRSLFLGGACLALLVLGLYDQTALSFVPNYASLKEDYRQEERFGQAIQQALPVGSCIMEWPLSAFPRDDGLIGYKHFLPYLHTHGLRWSYPAMENRAPAKWQNQLLGLAPEDLVQKLILAHFDAVLLDDRLHRPAEEHLLSYLLDERNLEPIATDGGTRFVFDLRTLKDQVRAGASLKGPAPGARQALNTSRDIVVEWGNEFQRLENGPAFPWSSWRWCRKSNGVVTVTNHLEKPVTAHLEMTIIPGDPAQKTVGVGGDLFSDAPPITDQVAKVYRRLTLSPGKHCIVIEVPGPGLNIADKKLFFRVEGFSLK